MQHATKRCTICGEDKPLDQFGNLAAARDGKRGQCRQCMNARRRTADAERRIADPEYRRRLRERERSRTRVADPEYRRKQAERRRRQRNDPEVRRREAEYLRGWRAKKLAENPEEYRRKGRDYQRSRRADPAIAERIRAAARARDAKPENRAKRTGYQREYWAQPENHERKKAHARKYTSKPEVQRRQRAYMSRPEVRERRRAYIRAWQLARTARKVAQFVEDVDPETVIERDGGYCGICGLLVEGPYHIDHIIPLSRGGEHSYANTQLAHPRCNLSKNARLPEEFVRS